MAYNDAIDAAGIRARRNPVGDDGRPVAKPDMTSPFFGVCWDRRHRKWGARVYNRRSLGLNGKQHCLGNFGDEVSAARAVDAYLRAVMPSIAATKVNFPTKKEMQMNSVQPSTSFDRL